MSTETSTFKLPIQAFAMWLATGERGISSETIASHLTGVPIAKYRDHPYDPSDFRRCERLLRAVPLARATFSSMAEVSPTWARFVERWDELVALAEEEVPGVFEGADGAAPRTYALMKQIREVQP